MALARSGRKERQRGRAPGAEAAPGPAGLTSRSEERATPPRSGHCPAPRPPPPGPSPPVRPCCAAGPEARERPVTVGRGRRCPLGIQIPDSASPTGHTLPQPVPQATHCSPSLSLDTANGDAPVSHSASHVGPPGLGVGAAVPRPCPGARPAGAGSHGQWAAIATKSRGARVHRLQGTRLGPPTPSIHSGEHRKRRVHCPHPRAARGVGAVPRDTHLRARGPGTGTKRGCRGTPQSERLRRRSVETRRGEGCGAPGPGGGPASKGPRQVSRPRPWPRGPADWPGVRPLQASVAPRPPPPGKANPGSWPRRAAHPAGVEGGAVLVPGAPGARAGPLHQTCGESARHLAPPGSRPTPSPSPSPRRRLGPSAATPLPSAVARTPWRGIWVPGSEAPARGRGGHSCPSASVLVPTTRCWAVCAGQCP